MRWVNRFRLQADQSVVYAFECACPPASRSHERMVAGAITNMHADCYLEDGVPTGEPPPSATEWRPPADWRRDL